MAAFHVTGHPAARTKVEHPSTAPIPRSRPRSNLNTRLALLTSLSLLLAACGQPASTPPVTADPDGSTPIHDLQGRTPGGDAASPLSGKAVVARGVVTADYQLSTQLKGFFMQAQDADADSDPSTSEGVFVLCDAACKDVSVGDSVQVAGTVTEFNTVTELTAVTAVTVMASGVALPAPQAITLPVASLNDYEKYEGMRVRVQGVVTENYKLGRGNVVKVADARIASYTQLNAPSVSGFAAHLEAVRRRTLPIDDGSTAQNPASVYGRGNAPLSAANTLRTGDNADVTGVLHYGFDYTGTPDTWRVESTPADAAFTGAARPAAPVVNGNVTVGSANVLNFFTTLVTSNADADNGGAPCTPGGTDAANSRGANDCFEYKRQLAKVVSNLSGLNADVIGLMEVQNNAVVGKGGDSLNTLVTALNSALGGDIYAAVAHPDPGSDAIRVAMIYRKASLTPVGAPLTDTDPVNNRLPLAQVFQAAGGSRFAVVVNHLKSKGSGTGADADLLDGQGASANKRELQVARLLDLIQNKIVVGRGVSDVISVGDYNAYDQEPSLRNLRKGLDGVLGNADDLSSVFGSDVYSYQFDAQFGSLDHAFVTQSLKARQVSGEKWHDNSDEPTVLDYNREFKTAAQVGSTAAPGTFFDGSAYRSSDHDPLKVGFTLPALSTLGVTPSGDAAAYTGQPYTLGLLTTGTPGTLDIDWGDGSTEPGLSGNTTSRSHTYSAAGTFTITVTARRGSETATGTQSVTVSAPSVSLSAVNASRDVNNGGGAAVTNAVTLTRSGYGGSLTLTASVSGAGAAPVVTVTAQPGTGNSGTVSIDGAGASVGSFAVNVTASGAGVGDATATFTVNVSGPAATSPGRLVISQVYGGGGNNGAPYTNDFIELFNAGRGAISLKGRSVQFVNATGTVYAVLALSDKTLNAGRSYLIQCAAGAGTPQSLPLPDQTDCTFAIGATSGKVALMSTTAPLVATGANVNGTANLLDFVGFGAAATQYEGAGRAVAPSNTTAVSRKLGGCQDTDQNTDDFSALAPAPRNSGSALTVCP